MSDEQVETEIKNILFMLALPKIKYWGINLIKYVQDLYEENYKILKKDIKEEHGDIETCPMSAKSKTQYCQDAHSSLLGLYIHAISIKIPSSYFADVSKLILKLYGEAKDLG